MSSDEANALAALNQFIMPNLQQSPSKMQPMDETLHRLMQGLPIFNQLIQSNSPSSPVETQTQLHPQQHQQQTTATQAAATPTIAVHEENPSSSESSESPRQGTPSNEQADQNSFAIAKDIKGLKNEGWYECFSTTKAREFDALIYSLYVMDKNDRKIDGYMYYECINRLQNKCRYKVRVKQKDEFYIVEERGGHNHAMEPVGQAGSHAGLPKTLREIVDKSFHEDWTPQQRQTKIDEEVRRMGLPPNPRLGRQVDNRMAYLRRVKNLNETKKIQDQAATPMGIESGLPQMMQMLLEQQGQGGGPMLENAATAEEMSAAQEMLQRFMAMAGGAVDMGDNSEMPMLDFNAANAFLSAGGVPVTPQGE